MKDYSDLDPAEFGSIDIHDGPEHAPTTATYAESVPSPAR